MVGGFSLSEMRTRARLGGERGFMSEGMTDSEELATRKWGEKMRPW